jgi:Icc protein
VTRLVQVTDTHLYADPGGRLLGQNTRDTLELVLELAANTIRSADRILLTGDLVHDESPAGYDYLHRRLLALGRPCNCLPGNHDDASHMRRWLAGGPVSLETSARCGDWNLVFLDSTVPGANGGHLDSGRLDLLEDALAAEPDSPALVCLHHQPLPVGSAWLDTMALDDPDAFFAVTDRRPQVRGVLWGHVHQEFAADRNGVILLGSPSTCVQFLPGSQDFAIDVRTPGFRWLDLHPDGRITTGVERIASFPAPLDPAAGGY